MYVFAVNDSEEINREYNLYYNLSLRNERPHKYVGLYKNKEVMYVAETKVIVIPTFNENKELQVQFIKGEENWNDKYKSQLMEFWIDERWGFDGKLKFHLFDELHHTSFKKTTPYGIMGPRTFYLPDYVVLPKSFDAKWLANELRKCSWE